MAAQHPPPRGLSLPLPTPPPLPPQHNISASSGSSVEPPGPGRGGEGIGGSQMGLVPPLAGGSSALPGFSSISAPGRVMIDQQRDRYEVAVNQHVSDLSRLVGMKDNENKALQAHLSQLEADFKYNYDVITQRDGELLKAFQTIETLHTEKLSLQDRAKVLEEKLDHGERAMQLLKADHQKAELDWREKLTLERKKHEEMRVSYEGKLREKEQQSTTAHESLQKHFLTRQEDENTFTEAQMHQLTAEHEKKEAAWLATDRALTKELDSLRAAVSEERTKAAQLKEELIEKETKIVSLTNVRDSLQRAKDDGDEEFQRIMGRLVVSEQSTMETRHESDHLRRAQEDRIHDLMQENSHSRSEHFALESKIDRLTSQLDEEKRNTDRRLTELNSKHRTAITEAQGTLREYEARIDALQLEVEAYRSTEKDQRDEIFSTKNEVLRRDSDLESLRRDTNRHLHDAEKLKLRVQELQAELEVKNKERRQEQGDFSARERDWIDMKENLQKRIHELERVRKTESKEAEEQSTKLKEELHRSESDRYRLQLMIDEDHAQARDLVIQRLTEERETLRRNVTELEEQNKRIREQIGVIRDEMENDPQLRAAKHNAKRVADLEDELVDAKTKVGQMELSQRQLQHHVTFLESEAMENKPPGDLIAKLTEEKHVLQRKVDELRHTTELASTEEGQASLRLEIERFRRQVDHLQKALNNMTNERDAARREYFDMARKYESAKNENESLVKLSNFHLAQTRHALDLQERTAGPAGEEPVLALMPGASLMPSPSSRGDERESAIRRAAALKDHYAKQDPTVKLLQRERELARQERDKLEQRLAALEGSSGSRAAGGASTARSNGLVRSASGSRRREATASADNSRRSRSGDGAACPVHERHMRDQQVVVSRTGQRARNFAADELTLQGAPCL